MIFRLFGAAFYTWASEGQSLQTAWIRTVVVSDRTQKYKRWTGSDPVTWPTWTQVRKTIEENPVLESTGEVEQRSARHAATATSHVSKAVAGKHASAGGTRYSGPSKFSVLRHLFVGFVHAGKCSASSLGISLELDRFLFFFLPRNAGEFAAYRSSH